MDVEAVLVVLVRLVPDAFTAHMADPAAVDGHQRLPGVSVEGFERVVADADVQAKGPLAEINPGLLPEHFQEEIKMLMGRETLALRDRAVLHVPEDLREITYMGPNA